MKSLRSCLVIIITLSMLTLAGCSNSNTNLSDSQTVFDNSNVQADSMPTSIITENFETESSSNLMIQETTSDAFTETASTSIVSDISSYTNSKVAEYYPRVQLEVKNIQQLPELPSGCEITSTTIVLNYLGFDVDKLTLMKYMPMMKAPDENDRWDSPWNVFIGSPDATRFGAYSPVIKTTIESYFSENEIKDYKVIDLKGSSVTELYDQLDAGYPVIVWATIAMNPSAPGKQWTLQDGTTFTWLSPEHCLVLIGYDLENETLIFSDPFDERGTVEYPYETFEKRYIELFQQALVVRPIE